MTNARSWLLAVALASACGPPRTVVGSGTKSDEVAGAAICTKREADPPRTSVESPCGTPLAVFTDGARTVTLEGPRRRFSEPSAGDAVNGSSWVRVLAAPFAGAFDPSMRDWLEGARADASPDILALAMEYVDGAPPAYNDAQVQIAGDAEYGPLSTTGVRLEGSDFADYLGLAWTYPDGVTVRPFANELHCLDCSGYIRMIWGYRSGLPLARGPDADGRALARRAVQIEASPFGVVIIPDTGAASHDFGRLRPGDLLFFDASADDGPAIDHVGMYLGLDEGGHPRFISSRKAANGPTLGDTGGASVLDGDGLYALAFRSARRL